MTAVTEDAAAPAELCPKCLAEPVKFRGWGKRCYHQWAHRNRRGTATDQPPLPPYSSESWLASRAKAAWGDEARRSARAVSSRKAAERLAAYRHLTRELGWQPYRAQLKLGISTTTRNTYERRLSEVPQEGTGRASGGEVADARA